MNHEAMRRAAELPTSGDAATPTLAASGGLEVPGREPHPPDAPPPANVSEPIPGEHDHSTEPSAPPASVGSTGFGGDVPPGDDPTLDEETKRQIRWEGGGKIRK